MGRAIETGRPQEAVFSSLRAEAASQSPESGRRANRYRVDLAVSVSSQHNFYSGFVENMSVGGVFIATHRLRPVGAQVEFSLSLPDGQPPLEGTGEVRWVRVYSETSHGPPGMGIRFLQLDAQGLQRVELFLAERDPLFHDED